MQPITTPQTAEQMFEHYVNSNNDICQHMRTLQEYASKCEIIVELGVRSIVSTWALLLGRPRHLLSIDIAHPSQYRDHDPVGGNLDLVFSEAMRLGVTYDFWLTSSIAAPIPSDVDLIFFDTVHTREQLSRELAAHGSKSRRYLIFHDTETFRDELMPAITAWLDLHPEWAVAQHWENNNGLTILKRLQHA